MNLDSAPIFSEEAARIAYYVILWILALVLVVGGLFRKRIGDRARVMLTCIVTFLIPLAVGSAVFALHGEEFIKDGVRAPGLEFNTRSFELYLESAKHLERKEDRYSIVLLGDSTHFYDLKAEEEMLAQFENALHPQLQEVTEVFGMRAAGLDAFDYYFLFNRLVSAKPDLLLIPINLRSFGSMWAGSAMSYFPSLERFVRWEEIPRASYLASEFRNIRWDLVSMRKIDSILSDRRIGRFLWTAKQRFEGEKTEWDVQFAQQFSDLGVYVPESWMTNQEAYYIGIGRSYESYIDEDHPMIQAFKALNRLANTHGIQVVYYNVESNRKDVRQVENFELIRDILVQDPNAHFIDTLGLVRYEHFTNREHINAEGVHLLAQYLANEVGKLVSVNMGLTGIHFSPMEKGPYVSEKEFSGLRQYVKTVREMSWHEVEALMENQELELATNTLKIWEKKNGPHP